jgi:formamidopyrimidine-DNA glycosylase
VGNIYADEALWFAQVHPLREARSLDEAEVAALHRGIRKALQRGIARQGSTLRDYRLPDGERGSMQHEFNVYGREGEPCPRCGMPIEKIRAGGRGTWYCPACQRSSAKRTGGRGLGKPGGFPS